MHLTAMGLFVLYSILDGLKLLEGHQMVANRARL
jgi:hypothetical protein